MIGLHFNTLFRLGLTNGVHRLPTFCTRLVLLLINLLKCISGLTGFSVSRMALACGGGQKRAFQLAQLLFSGLTGFSLSLMASACGGRNSDAFNSHNRALSMR
jgi:hypothetical protein